MSLERGKERDKNKIEGEVKKPGCKKRRKIKCFFLIKLFFIRKIKPFFFSKFYSLFSDI